MPLSPKKEICELWIIGDRGAASTLTFDWSELAKVGRLPMAIPFLFSVLIMVLYGRTQVIFGFLQKQEIK